MNWKGYVLITFSSICFVFIGIGIGRESMTKANNQLYKEYESLKSSYNNLETDLKDQYYDENKELQWNLDSCYQQLGDIEDNPYDVNRDGTINAPDYVILKNRAEYIKDYIMEEK